MQIIMDEADLRDLEVDQQSITRRLEQLHQGVSAAEVSLQRLGARLASLVGAIDTAERQELQGAFREVHMIQDLRADKAWAQAHRALLRDLQRLTKKLHALYGEEGTPTRNHA